MPTFESTRDDYARLWAAAELRPERAQKARRAAALIQSHRDRYVTAGAPLGVPWAFVGLVHLRESYCSFNTHLHNGDTLTARTRHVPAGRPLVGSPPFTWEASAEDALRQKSLEHVEEWSVERFLYELERYNGFGYRNHGHLSPYLWADTTMYDGGKYVRDGVYDSGHVDTQPGTGDVLKILLESEPDMFEKHAAVAEAVRSPRAGEDSADDPPPLSTRSRKYALSNWGSKIYGAICSFLLVIWGKIQGAWDDPFGALDQMLPLVQEYGVEAAIIVTFLGFGAFQLYRYLIVDDLNHGSYQPSGDRK